MHGERLGLEKKKKSKTDMNIIGNITHISVD